MCCPGNNHCRAAGIACLDSQLPGAMPMYCCTLLAAYAAEASSACMEGHMGMPRCKNNSCLG